MHELYKHAQQVKVKEDDLKLHRSSIVSLNIVAGYFLGCKQMSISPAKSPLAAKPTHSSEILLEQLNCQIINVI